eukprot:4192191-Lingulodinium_polyedra.AAC.1
MRARPTCSTGKASRPGTWASWKRWPSRFRRSRARGSSAARSNRRRPFCPSAGGLTSSTASSPRP